MMIIHVFKIYIPVGNLISQQFLADINYLSLPRYCAYEDNGGNAKQTYLFCDLLASNTDYLHICEKYGYEYKREGQITEEDKKWSTAYHIVPTYDATKPPYRLITHAVRRDSTDSCAVM
jgi:hypothetical protein